MNPLEYAAGFFDPSNLMRETGQLAIKDGRPVVWAGPALGWQSPEAYYTTVTPQYFRGRTGASTPAELYSRASYLSGYNPDGKRVPPKPKTKDEEAQGTITPGDSVDGKTPPAAPTLPPPPDLNLPETKAPYSGTTIPQKEEAGFERLVDLIERTTSPERIAQIEGMRAENFLRSQLLTSELTRAGERARYARDIEKENIQAWQNIRTAQIQANAAQQAALGLGMISAFAPPNASALAGTLQAAMQPFSNMSFKRG
jgi:hypothetical protein